jgi:hypothetical protein
MEQNTKIGRIVALDEAHKVSGLKILRLPIAAHNT